MTCSKYEYYRTENGCLYNGDALEVLKSLPDGIIQTCITSPPYWGLRDYGTAEWEGGDAGCKHYICGDGGFPGEKQKTNSGSLRIAKDVCPTCGAIRKDRQLGLEKTPEEYVAKMVEIFREVRRVLRDDGTLWLNLGDSYATHASGGKGHKHNFRSWEVCEKEGIDQPKPTAKSIGLKEKDLCGIPWRVAFALQAAGWYLRSDIIWSKPNPMPESVTDRPTKAHEYIFLMSKSAKYFYDADAIKEADHPDGRKQTVRLQTNRYDGPLLNKFQDNEHQRWSGSRNKRTVWTIATMPYKEAHFATFPPKLIEPCILAGCPEKETVLDPFAGAGTTLLVSEKYGRKWIGIELNQEYCSMIFKRLEPEIRQRKLF